MHAAFLDDHVKARHEPAQTLPRQDHREAYRVSKLWLASLFPIRVACFVMTLFGLLARGRHEASWLGWQCGSKLDQSPASAADKAEGRSQAAPINEAGDAVELEDILRQEDGQSPAHNHPGHSAQSTKPHPPSTARALCIWSAIICGVLCPFLDEGIIATTIPQITEDFHSLLDIGVSLQPLAISRRERESSYSNSGTDHHT